MKSDGNSPNLNKTPSSGALAPDISAILPVLRRFAIRVARRNWKTIIIGFAIILVISVLTTLLGTKRSWEATVTLLYSPLPVPQDFQTLYEPPDLSSIQSLAKSRPLLEQLKDEFNLPVPVKSLRNLVRVEPAPGSEDMLEVSVEWGSADEAVAMVDFMASRFPQEVSRVRKQALDSIYSNLQAHLQECDSRLAAARKRLADYAKSQNVVDLKTDLASLQDEIRALEESMEKSKFHSLELSVQAEKLSAHLDNLKRQEAEKAREAKKYEAAHESVADARRRQDRLRELINEERRVLEVKAQLEVKRREYERAAVLVEKQLIPRTRFEKIQGEMESLMAQIEENKRILKWKSELKRIDKTVVPKGNVKQVGSPIIAQVLFRKLELDLQIIAAQKKQFELHKALTKKRSIREQLIQLRHKFQALEDNVTAVEDERRSVEDRLSVLRTLRSLGTVELTVIAPPKASEHPVGSNRKYLFAGVLALCILVFVSGLLGQEIRHGGLFVLDDKLTQLGLDKLGEMSMTLPAGSHDDKTQSAMNTKTIRQLALQIRQTVTKPGAIILFSQLDNCGNAPALLAQLAWCFARRDERVLIWAANESHTNQRAFANLIGREECSEKQEGLPGLGEFLSYVCVNLDEFIMPSEIPGVDCLLSGQTRMPPEGLSTHRMQELLTQLRAKYTIILVDGPTLDQVDELELALAYCDGVIFLAHDLQSISPQAGNVLHDMKQLEAPIIGAMVI